MTRTIVTIHSDGTVDKFVLRKPLDVYPDDHIESTLTINSTDPDVRNFRNGVAIPGLVKTVGIKLVKQLVANVAVQQALQAAANQAALSARHNCVLCFDTRSPSA